MSFAHGSLLRLHGTAPFRSGKLPAISPVALGPVALGLVALGLAGCASPGPPQPPSLHLPSLATGLKAERLGNHVTLSWSTPANTTDGDALREPVRAVLCRQVDAGKTTPCQAVQRMTFAAGPSQLSDALPPVLTTGPPSLLVYRVELLNSRGRSAGVSPPAFTAAGAAPPPVAGLTLEAHRDGALATWQPQPSSAVVELRRINLATTQAKSPKPDRQISTQKASSLRGFPQPAPGNQALPGVVILRADGASSGPPNVTDAGGVLDRSVRDGESYTYSAQRVQSLSLHGHPVELRSEPSVSVTFAFYNVFPPRAPAALVSVPSAGFGTAASIDLSWNPGAEDDLAGYNLYRKQDAESFVRINSSLITEPAFHDVNVQPGHTYTYRVTAIDQRNKESNPGSETRENLRR